MKYIADLHIHSHYSRATSKEMTPENLWLWAQLKGIKVIGTGDLTHPGWLMELSEKLKMAPNGLFVLKEEYRRMSLPEAVKDEVYFMLTGEVSSIYKKGGDLKKIHNLIFLPRLEDAFKLQGVLSRVANIEADGRPIVGMDAKDLLEIVLSISPSAVLLPAHAWTPHFSIFGSESGFDSVEECFEDYTDHIWAIETGLSSDPPMNWMVSKLDRFTLVSNSDAHSPQRIGREANLLEGEISYEAIREAIRTRKGFLGTIEFFPQEGKYHFDGHKNCKVVFSPEETIKNNYLCPKCKERVTIGVMHRVHLLADRKDGERPLGAPSYTSLVPLMEIIAEAYGVGVGSKRVETEYFHMLSQLGNEFHILMLADLDEIERCSSYIVREGIKRVREGRVKITPGYDGVYGKIRIFEDEERVQQKGQLVLF